MSEPIWIDCEGVGCPTHQAGGIYGFGMCQMCGHTVATDHHGVALYHRRDDVIARLERGDFD